MMTGTIMYELETYQFFLVTSFLLTIDYATFRYVIFQIEFYIKRVIHFH